MARVTLSLQDAAGAGEGTLYRAYRDGLGDQGGYGGGGVLSRRLRWFVPDEMDTECAISSYHKGLRRISRPRGIGCDCL